MKSAQQVMKAAEELDARRRQQIMNQIETINRLLGGGWKYDDEMRTLHEQLAAAQVNNQGVNDG